MDRSDDVSQNDKFLPRCRSIRCSTRNNRLTAAACITVLTVVCYWWLHVSEEIFSLDFPFASLNLLPCGRQCTDDMARSLLFINLSIPRSPPVHLRVPKPSLHPSRCTTSVNLCLSQVPPLAKVPSLHSSRLIAVTVIFGIRFSRCNSYLRISCHAEYVLFC